MGRYHAFEHIQVLFRGTKKGWTLNIIYNIMHDIILCNVRMISSMPVSPSDMSHDINSDINHDVMIITHDIIYVYHGIYTN
jgi:hypothetical protein